MGDQSRYQGMYVPAAPSYSSQGGQQHLGNHGQFYPPNVQSTAHVPQNYYHQHASAPGIQHGFSGTQNYFPRQPVENAAEFKRPPMSQLFSPQYQAFPPNSHRPSLAARLPGYTPASFGNVQPGHSALSSQPRHPVSLSQPQQQFITSRPTTPLNFRPQSNQSMPASSLQSVPMSSQHSTSPALNFALEKQVNANVIQGQIPVRHQEPNHQTFGQPIRLNQGPHEDATNFHGKNYPATGGIPNPCPLQPAASSNGQVTSVQSSNVGPTLLAPKVETKGQNDYPMLVNPLLKAKQEGGPVQVQNLPQRSAEAIKANADPIPSKHPKTEARYDDDEEDNEDDEEEYSDRTETYSSGSSSASSHDYIQQPKNSMGVEQNRHMQASRQNKSSGHRQHHQQRVSSHGAAHGLGYPGHVERAYNYEGNFQNLSIDNRNVCIDLFKEQNLIADLDYDESFPPLDKELRQFNCPPEIMASTLNVVPKTSALLGKARLPFGILLHPLKDIQDLPEGRHLVRCRSCRSYINPFSTVIDERRWRCNICYKNNEFPGEYLNDPQARMFQDLRQRVEMSSSCYEMQVSIGEHYKDRHFQTYVFLLDVSFNAIETGYLSVLCDLLLEYLDCLTGDPKSNICFVTFDSHIHFYNLSNKLSQPQVYHVVDLEDVMPPSPKGLMVNINESKDNIRALLRLLPSMHKDNKEIGNCLGVALKAVCTMMGSRGGRVSVFQTKIPDTGEGALKSREDPNRRASEDVQHLAPSSNFYKSMAVECSSRQVGFDLFYLNSQYIDMASINPLAKFTGGCIEYFPNFHQTSNLVEVDRFKKFFERYMTRETGSDAVLKIRCSKGLTFQAYHGNTFIRHIDLLGLPVTNADASFALQVAIESPLEDSMVYFQAALLYTNSRGERRLRVENLCLQVSSDLSDIFFSANQQAIAAMVSKMAVDRAISSSVSDSREALANVASDMLEAFSAATNSGVKTRQLPCPYLLRALPMLVFAIMKSTAFRLGISTKLDDRVYAFEQLKNLPWPQLIQLIYPHFYALHTMNAKNSFQVEDKVICQPYMLPLTAGALDRQGIHLMDTGEQMYLWLSSSVKKQLLKDVFDVSHFGSLQEGLVELPELDNPTSENIRNFIEYLNSLRQVPAPLVLLRDDGGVRMLFYQKLLEDRTSDVSNMSYVEFLRSLHERLPSD